MPYEPGSKIIIGGEVILDLTGDDVTEADVASGKIFHKRDGTQTFGTNTFDADTRDGTATAAEMLNGKTAYVNGNKLTGTMPNRGAQTGAISTKTGSVVIQQGYHDGSGRVNIAESEQAKIVEGNIREGVTILGVTGTMSGSEDVVAAPATVTPALTDQTFYPSDFGENVNSISEIIVNPIPIVITDNTAGGKTYTIG